MRVHGRAVRGGGVLPMSSILARVSSILCNSVCAFPSLVRIT